MSWRDLKGIAREFMQKYNQRGQEVPDPTPVEVPFKWRRPKDIHEMIAEAVQSHELQRKWSEEGRESWDEANDFEVGDEDFRSPYELTEMQEEFYDSDRRDIAAKRREDGRKGNARRAKEGKAGASGVEGIAEGGEGTEKPRPKNGGDDRGSDSNQRKGVDTE